MIVCELCKKTFKKITARHLQDKHQTTLESYKQMFPQSPLVSPETLARMSKSLSGIKRSEEQKNRSSEAHLKSWQQNPNQGKTGQIMSEECKQAISKTLQGHAVSTTTRNKLSDHSWNKGKTKETDSRLMDVSLKMRKNDEEKS